MKHLSTSRRGDALHIEDYPQAVALKQVDSADARELMSLALHHSDMVACKGFIDDIYQFRNLPNSEHLIHALWIAAIALFFKCFGRNDARGRLSAKEVFADHDGALPVFQFFKDLRDKHLIHDENPYSQGAVALVINPIENPHKVADVLSMSFHSFTADESHVDSFSPLVEVASGWVWQKMDRLHSKIAQEFELISHPELMALPDVQYSPPTADSAGSSRRSKP